MSIALSINLNKIALIRNSREGNYPDVVEHGRTCLEAGANGITVHPRPDQRHIRPNDVRELRQLTNDFSDVEFNIEGNPFADALGSYPGLLALAQETRPQQCTLVPDSQDQLTSDHGFDLTQKTTQLSEMIKQLHGFGVRVSLFMDPDLEQIKRAKDIGADRIELYTGPFADAFARDEAGIAPIFKQYCDAAKCAEELGLGINAGHDLNLPNMRLFKTLPALKEVSIGHALTVDAINMGLISTVKSYLEVCK